MFRETVLSIVRERYPDFGPTLAAEKLSELHGLDLGVETLRQWMIGAGIWVRRKDRLKRIHQPRARRDCLGELVQIDGSEHWWFEDRGPQSTLLVYVDDGPCCMDQPVDAVIPGPRGLIRCGRSSGVPAPACG